MSRISMTLAGAAAVLLFVATPAMASQDVESQLAEMRDLVQALQQKVDAQDEQLAHQGELLEGAQEVVQRTQQEQSALSGLAKFLDAVEFDGNVAGSYMWNINVPDQGRAGGIGSNTGFSGAFMPYHPDHNSFQLDHVWFGMGKPATKESRAGFRFDLAFGQTASSMQTNIGGWRRAFGADAASEIYVAQAYVEYLAPVGDGLNVTFGKFEALTGAESLDSTKNFNITHSNVYNLMQPIHHLGATATAMAGPVELTFGYVNSSSTRTMDRMAGNGLVTGPDDNSEKTYIGSAAFKQDNLAVKSTVIYGAEMGQNGVKNGLADVVMTFDANDQLSMWIMGDYAWVQGKRMAAWGLAAAARMALSEKAGISLRGEYLKDKASYGSGWSGSYFGINNVSTGISEIFGLTGTLDYTLVENLVVRGEMRWDQVRQRNGDAFPKTSTRTEKHQVTAGAQVVYNF